MASTWVYVTRIDFSLRCLAVDSSCWWIIKVLKDRSLIFVGNASSTHLEHWVKIYRLAGYSGPIAIASKDPLKSWEHGPVIYAPPACRRFRVYSVFVLALKLFWQVRRMDLVHVHSVGWYGVVACFLRSRVIATVYGSEIAFGEPRSPSSIIQRYLFRHANLTHVTSGCMGEKLRARFNVGRLVCIHTGVDAEFLQRSSWDGDLESLVICHSRSVAPNYRSAEVIMALAPYLREKPRSALRLICGHAHLQYVADCKKLATELGVRSNCVFIERFLEPSEYIQELRDSVVTVSVPERDQIGASIVESLAVGVPVILTGNMYGELRGVAGCYFMDSFADLPSLVLQAASERRSGLEISVPPQFDIQNAAVKFRSELEYVLDGR